MNSNEPVELISHIRAIFHFLGGICVLAEDGTEISIIKVSLEEFKPPKDDSVSLALIEERINNIQGTDPRLKLMISKTLPKLLASILEEGRFQEDDKVVFFSFSEFLDSLRQECELLELE